MFNNYIPYYVINAHMLKCYARPNQGGFYETYVQIDVLFIYRVYLIMA